MRKEIKIVMLILFLVLGFFVPYLYSSIQGNYAISVIDSGNSLQYHTCIGDNTNGLWVNVKTGTVSVTGNVTVVQPTGTNLHTVLDSGTLTSVTNAVTVVQPTGTNLHTVLDSGTLTSVTNAVTVAQSTATSLNANVNTLTTISGANACMNPTSTLASISSATSTTAAVQIIASSGSKKIYVCSMTVVSVSGTTPTFSLVYGTGTNCGTGQGVLIQAFPTSATAGTFYTFANPTAVTPASQALCYLDTDSGTPVQNYTISYVQQ